MRHLDRRDCWILTHHFQIYPFDWESIRLTESLQRHGKKRREPQWPPLRPLRGLIRKRFKRGPQTPLDAGILN